MAEAERNFASVEDEVAYWKKRAAVLEQENKDVKDEFDEFREGSRELEQEMEVQLEQDEAKIKEFRSLTSRLQRENEQLKEKLDHCHNQYQAQVSLKAYFFVCTKQMSGHK